jgi:hypothetical protein
MGGGRLIGLLFLTSQLAEIDGVQMGAKVKEERIFS